MTRMVRMITDIFQISGHPFYLCYPRSISRFIIYKMPVAIQVLITCAYRAVNRIINLPLGRRVMSGSSSTWVPGSSVSR